MKASLALLCVLGAIVAGFAIRNGPCCRTPGDFRDMVAQEIPALADAGALERAELLLAWSANTADYAADGGAYRGGTENMLPHKVYSDVFEPDSGGVYCGGQAVFYKNVLHLFGVEAFTVDFGTLEHGLTHVTVIVAHEGRFYIFDPTFGVTYRKNGRLVPVDQLLAGGLEGVQVSEVSLADRDYLLSGPDLSFCRTEPAKAGAFYRCGRGDASFLDFYLAGWGRWLEDASIPTGIETLPALMREGIFSVGPALNPSSRKRFLKMLAEYDIPMH